VFLKLLYRDGCGLEEKKQYEVKLEDVTEEGTPVKTVKIEFSNDCKYLAIYMKELGTLKICKIREAHEVPHGIEPIEQAFRDMRAGEYYWQFPSAPHDDQGATAGRRRKDDGAQLQFDDLGDPDEQREHMDDVDDLVFDTNSRFLVLKGRTHIRILDLDNKRHEPAWTLAKAFSDDSPKDYEKIYDVSLDSNPQHEAQFLEGREYRC